jgi:hypothetical protein
MKLTKEQGIILTGYTGLMLCKFSDFHKDVEKRLGCPVFTHQFGDKAFAESLKSVYKDDFMAILPEED